MTKGKELEWGQTPFDNMSRSELLVMVRRMYSAVASLNSVVNQYRHFTPGPYWDQENTGGRALTKGTSVLESIHAEHDPDNIYRAYYRYADELLFPELVKEWAVCSSCGSMVGLDSKSRSAVGKKCTSLLGHTPKCPGIFRSLDLSDLRPISEGGDTK